MSKIYIYSDTFPDDVDFFTPGKRYEVIDKYNDNYTNWKKYQATVIGDDGKEHNHVNVGQPCAFLDDGMWNVEVLENGEEAS